MIISTNQPYFAPYPGFFYKALQSDCLVILDEVQFPRKTTWITRNRFKNDQGALWMTIPVLKRGLGLQKISEVRICQAGNWQKKHLQSFQSAYAHAPYLPEHLDVIARLLCLPHDRLLEMNLTLIKHIMQYLKIETRMVLMSELGVSGKGTPLIIDICKSLNATRYLVQSSALAYYDPDQFRAAGIELTAFKKPEYIYPQLWGNFIANLSMFDMIFNCGPKAREILAADRGPTAPAGPTRPATPEP